MEYSETPTTKAFVKLLTTSNNGSYFSPYLKVNTNSWGFWYQQDHRISHHLVQPFTFVSIFHGIFSRVVGRLQTYENDSERSIYMTSLLSDAIQNRWNSVNIDWRDLKYTNANLKMSLYVCVHKKHCPENFAFLILRILELFTPEVCKFLKK